MAPKNNSPAYVIGVGMTKFIKPRGLREYPEMAFESGGKALLDAQINYDDVDFGVACYSYGDSTCGERVFYQFGMSSIPVINTANACATGSIGLYLARTLIKNGAAHCVLAIGWEKMKPGSIKSPWDDRPSATEMHMTMMVEKDGLVKGPLTPQYFGNAGREYMRKYGATAEDFAEIGRLSHEHSQRNPYAQFRQAYTLQEVLDSPMIFPPLTKLQCSPTSDGSAAAVIVSQEFLDARPHLKSQAILMAGQQFCTDSPKAFSGSAIELVGYDMTQRAARQAMTEANVTPEDVRVCELHDCFSSNQLVTVDALGLSEPGKAHELVRSGDLTYGGKVVINPSGGLMSKGHPLGATGLAQCAELVWQLRGWANNRLVKDTAVALQHNLGLGGAVVINVYKRYDGKTNAEVSDADIKRNSWLGYNAAVEARGLDFEDAERIRSKKHRNDFALGTMPQKLNARL